MPTTFSIIEQGQIIVGTEGKDGSFFTAALLNPGDHFGDPTLFAGLPRLENLRTLGNTRICHIPAKRFLALFDQEPDIGRALLTITLRRMHLMMEVMDGQRRWPLTVRIAHMLLTSVSDADSAENHTITCRHDDLAKILGVSRVAVSKALKTLQQDDWLVMHYGSVEICDVQALTAWLDDTYQVAPITPDANWQF